MILRTTKPRETLISGVWWNKEVFPKGSGYRVYMLQFCAMILKTTNHGILLFLAYGGTKKYFLKVMDTGFIFYSSAP